MQTANKKDEAEVVFQVNSKGQNSDERDCVFVDQLAAASSQRRFKKHNAQAQRQDSNM
jgi:hypothetical protein